MIRIDLTQMLWSSDVRPGSSAVICCRFQIVDIVFVFLVESAHKLSKYRRAGNLNKITHGGDEECEQNVWIMLPSSPSDGETKGVEISSTQNLQDQCKLQKHYITPIFCSHY